MSFGLCFDISEVHIYMPVFLFECICRSKCLAAALLTICMQIEDQGHTLDVQWRPCTYLAPFQQLRCPSHTSYSSLYPCPAGPAGCLYWQAQTSSYELPVLASSDLILWAALCGQHMSWLVACLYWHAQPYWLIEQCKALSAIMLVRATCWLHTVVLFVSKP